MTEQTSFRYHYHFHSHRRYSIPVLSSCILFRRPLHNSLAAFSIEIENFRCSFYPELLFSVFLAHDHLYWAFPGASSLEYQLQTHPHVALLAKFI